MLTAIKKLATAHRLRQPRSRPFMQMRIASTMPSRAFSVDYVEVEPESTTTDLITQYRLIPVAEHPLFPGSSQALQLTQDQYEVSCLLTHSIRFSKIPKKLCLLQWSRTMTCSRKEKTSWRSCWNPTERTKKVRPTSTCLQLVRSKTCTQSGHCATRE